MEGETREEARVRAGFRRIVFVAWLIHAGIFFGAGVSGCETSRTTSESCTTCAASRKTTETGLWVGNRRRVNLGATVKVSGEDWDALRTVFRGGHQHQWSPSGASWSFLGIRTLRG